MGIYKDFPLALSLKKGGADYLPGRIVSGDYGTQKKFIHHQSETRCL